MSSGRRVVRRVSLTTLDAETGFAFTARTHHPELSSHERPSAAVVLEDGRPLAGPANAMHDDIRTAGGGRFSFWYDYVYFSTNDNSDPRTNGRRYEIEYTVNKVRDVVARIRERVFAAGRPSAGAIARNYAAERLLEMWRRIGCTPSPEARILDFGCGAGERVDALRRLGYQAFGCDVMLPARPVGRLLDDIQQGVIRPIGHPYRVPFEDNSFDLVFSVTVFEHVMDYDSALAEIRRVLKSGGVAVHVFPPPWKFLETHVFVPYASVFQAWWWLYLWALLGVRNRFQRGYPARRTADVNYAFLKNETNYLPKRRIREHVLRHFDQCRFVEEAAFSRRRFAFFSRRPLLLPLYRNWFSETHGRVLVCR